MREPNDVYRMSNFIYVKYKVTSVQSESDVYFANSDWAKSVFSIPEASPTPMRRPTGRTRPSAVSVGRGRGAA